MSRTANASISVIENVKSRNNDFCSEIFNLRNAFYDALNELKADCDSKANEYNAMAGEVESLLSKAKQKQAKACAQASASSSAASSTPKTIKETYTDSDGQKHTKEKPNPAYAAAQAQAANAKQSAQAADGVVANITRFKEYISSRVSGLRGMQQSIADINSSVRFALDNGSRKAESANDSLQRTINALNDYKNLDIR